MAIYPVVGVACNHFQTSLPVCAESSVYLGTSDGKVLVYHISERQSAGSQMEAGCEHQLTIKAKKPVEQIKACPMRVKGLIKVGSLGV